MREYREYERTSTTALNAFIGPRVQTYLGRLESHLRDEKFAGKLNIMRSNGGVMSVRLAQEQPVSMMESGPVAGIIGAGRLAALLGIERAIGFDMGGTTAKASLITNGVPAIEDGYVIGGEASGQPMQIAGGRHRRDRRGRRLDRLVRSDRRHPCRAEERGRRSGPGRPTARARPIRW